MNRPNLINTRQRALFLTSTYNQKVTSETLDGIPALADGIKIISQTVAGLPLHVYRDGKNGRERAPYHHLYGILYRKPNGYMTSFNFWELLTKDLVKEGNAYCLIDRKTNTYRDVKALHPLTASCVSRVVNKAGKTEYHYSNGSTKKIYKDSQIWHIQNSGNGLEGRKMYEQFAESLRQMLVIEKFTSLYFEQGVTSNMIMETPVGVAPPSEKGMAVLKDLFRRKNGGLENAHTPVVLPGGFTIKELAKLSLKDSQLLELKTYNINQIARMLQLPPHIIGELSKSSFNNIVEQNRNLLTFSVNPYLKRIEGAVNAFLMHEWEQNAFYSEFTRDALLEANPKEKAEQVKTLVSGGIMSVNEGRKMYNLSDVENGSKVQMMTNMQFLEDGNKELREPPSPGKDEAPEEPDAEPANNVPGGEEKEQMNGAQISAAKDIVQSVAAGELPRGSGLAMLEELFGFSAEQAEKMMGESGKNLPKEDEPNE